MLPTVVPFIWLARGDYKNSEDRTMSFPRMPCRAISGLFGAALGLALGQAVAGTYSLIHTFTGGADGADPAAALVQDHAGNLYGQTDGGAAACAGGPHVGCGTVYKISPTGVLTTLVTFTGTNGVGGDSPLTLIGQTLYGSTATGGQHGYGAVFSVHTDGSFFQRLHSFSNTDGSEPVGTLRAGLHNVGYGVTYEGGTTGDGVLYELKSDGTFVLLHNFNLAAAGNAAGANPTNIVVGSSGIIYGSTQNGGGAIDCGPDGGEGCGVIFAYDPATGVYRVLHAFMESDGAFPTLGSIGADGTLYGSTSGGGPVRAGTLFSLSTSGPNPLFSSLYSFMDTTDGIDPQAGPTLEPDGSLIGTTNAGTAGTLYQFAHGTLTTLHDPECYRQHYRGDAPRGTGALHGGGNV
jgi:uncharacterized repeat protein (TIGR03803 family)